MLETLRDGEVRDPHENLMHLTLGIVAKTLFDAELSEDAETVGHSLEVVMNHFMSPMRWFKFLDYLPIPLSRRYWRAIGRLAEIIYKIIKSHRAEGRDRATCSLACWPHATRAATG